MDADRGGTLAGLAARAAALVRPEVSAYWAGGDPDERAAAAWREVALHPHVLRACTPPPPPPGCSG